MMRFCVSKLNVTNKKVMLRCDFDVPLIQKGNRVLVGDDTRLQLSLKTIRYLLRKKAKVVIIAHLGRPEGEKVKNLSMQPVFEVFSRAIGNRAQVDFLPNILGRKVENKVTSLQSGEIIVLENLRFDPGEEENNVGFAKKLALLADVFVNEAFAASHRKHASIVGIPRFLPSAFGFNFIKEVEVLKKVYQHPRRPVVLILGGKKQNKLKSGQALLSWVDTLLVGGELVETNGITELVGHQKVRADLTKKGEDITLGSAREFAMIIKKAGTIVWSGPMGAYEDYRYLKGTEEVAKAIIASKAFSVVGGGDTEAALTKLGLVGKISHICSGGGAMLDFLAQHGTLPGIAAIVKKSDVQ
ncbi:MAG TPA: phosphoglycerate kinase [Candidatus Bathyarchaeia archaeon]|nr:phosphoglycerate kinase [Candidatus Bathyarchaeia archaeon]